MSTPLGSHILFIFVALTLVASLDARYHGIMRKTDEASPWLGKAEVRYTEVQEALCI